MLGACITDVTHASGAVPNMEREVEFHAACSRGESLWHRSLLLGRHRHFPKLLRHAAIHLLAAAAKGRAPAAPPGAPCLFSFSFFSC